MQYAKMQYARCNMQDLILNMQYSRCNLQDAMFKCNIQDAICKGALCKDAMMQWCKVQFSVICKMQDAKMIGV